MGGAANVAAKADDLGARVSLVGVIGADERAAEARAVRERGGRVVFTNGSFDLLHYGHAHLLQAARAQGDFLILGLNTDASIRRLKGPGRPIVPQHERATMLSLYSFIDLVVLFDEDTPLELIKAIRPDILVKGGDYSRGTVVGHELVESWGGRVHLIPLVEGLSTSRLMEKIQTHNEHDASRDE